MALFSPNSRVFGLEIGSHTLKVADISHNYFGYHIHGVNEVTLDQSPWLKNGLRNKEGLAKQIAQSCQEAQPHPIKGQRAVCTLPEFAVFSKVIQLPKISQQELAQTIPFEAAEFLPLPLEEVYLDWHFSPNLVMIDNKPHHHILVVAAPKQLVDDLVEVGQDAELEIVGIESESFALVRALAHRLQKDSLTIIASVDHRITTIILATAQTIKITSTALVGTIKLRHNLADGVRTIAEEISDTMSYYHNRLGEKEPINGIVLTGSGAVMKGLDSQLAQATKLSCQVGYSPIKLPNGAAVHPRFNTVIGLSLRKQL